MSHLYQIRLCIETTSPMAIQTGQSQDLGDNQILTDVNSLPYIPASSFIGAWRNLVKANYGKEQAELWFGNGEKQSLLSVSNGYLHNSQNQPVQGLLNQAQIEQDSLLSILQFCKEDSEGIIKRDRTAINDRGVVKKGAKFDQLFLPTGLRFSFKCHAIIGNTELDTIIDILEQVFNSAFSLGCNTSNGNGRFKILNKYSGFQKIELCSQTQSDYKNCLNFNNSWIVPPNKIDVKTTNAEQIAHIPLYCEGAWTMGSGTSTLLKYKKDNVSSIYQESFFDYELGKISTRVIATGSSIKGLIAHRMQYHLNCIERRFAEQSQDLIDITDFKSFEKDKDAFDIFFGHRSESFNQLFGFIDDDKSNNAQAGALIFEDSVVSYSQNSQIQLRTHNNIDRFTGGARDKYLFNEEVLVGVSFDVKVVMLPRAKLIFDEHPQLKIAFLRTLKDIEFGRLAIGSKTGRGNSMTRLAKNKQAFIHPILSVANLSDQGVVA